MATFSFVLTCNFKLPNTVVSPNRKKKLSIHLIDISCINIDCMLKSEKKSCLFNPPILLCTACYKWYSKNNNVYIHLFSYNSGLLSWAR